MRGQPNQIRPMRPAAADPAPAPSAPAQPKLDLVNSRAPKANDFGTTEDLDKVQSEPTPRASDREIKIS